MKRISEIRLCLSEIPGALYEMPLEESHADVQGDPVTVWSGEEDFLGDDSKVYAAIDTDYVEEETGSTEAEQIFEIPPEMDRDRLNEIFAGEAGEIIKRSVLQNGVDALGWYVPFHYKGAQWGTYISATGLAYFVSRIFGSLRVDPWASLQIAFRVIHQHELFHFAVDYMSSQWECITGKPCHKPARSLKDGELGYNVAEEQLANAQAFRSLNTSKRHMRVKGRADALRLFFRSQPRGYSEADKIKQWPRFCDSASRLASRYVNCIDGYDTSLLRGIDLLASYPNLGNIDWRYCPFHIIHDERRFDIPRIDLGLFRRVLGIKETDAFLRALRNCPKQIQQAWQKTKNMLAQTTTARGTDFKFWLRKDGGSVFPVRLNNNYRAHLLYSAASKTWSALMLGTHKEMGH